MNQLVNDLRAALVASVPNGSNGRRRRRANRVRVPASTVVVPAALPAVQPKQQRRKRRKNKPGKSLSSEGTLRLSKSELIGTVTTGGDGKGHGSIPIAPDSFGLLKSLMRSFERICWHAVSVSYRPAVGTTSGGLITYGVDWDSKGDAADRSSISAYTPCATHAIWADNSARPMVLPAGKLQSRLWYLPDAAQVIDRQPGDVVYAVQGPASTSVGEFWIKYSVTLSGTRPA
jgi:hypothetical protein